MTIEMCLSSFCHVERKEKVKSDRSIVLVRSSQIRIRCPFESRHEKKHE